MYYYYVLLCENHIHEPSGPMWSCVVLVFFMKIHRFHPPARSGVARNVSRASRAVTRERSLKDAASMVRRQKLMETMGFTSQMIQMLGS
jgi:hypothetical protein